MPIMPRKYRNIYYFVFCRGFQLYSLKCEGKYLCDFLIEKQVFKWLLLRKVVYLNKGAPYQCLLR